MCDISTTKAQERSMCLARHKWHSAWRCHEPLGHSGSHLYGRSSWGAKDTLEASA